MKVVIICGSRDGRLDKPETDWLDQQYLIHDWVMVLTGGAPGVDRFADLWAESRGIVRVTFHAAWRGREGKAAGPQRNQRMATYIQLLGCQGMCVAFPGGTGTEGMVRIAQAFGYVVLRYPGNEWRVEAVCD